MEWYEIWSKAGASPNYIVENVSEYVRNFNWVPNWIDNYFFNKMSDFLLGTLFAVFFVAVIFKIKKISLINFYKYKYFYLILVILIFEWFLNHPALRYGGYVLFFLILSLSVSIILSNLKYKIKDYKKSINAIILITIIVFASRNINRLVHENQVYKYNLIKSPFYNIQDSYFTMKNNKKRFFYDISICDEKNSIANIKCKKIKGYNFYYK